MVAHKLLFAAAAVAGLFMLRALGGTLLVRTYFDPDEFWQCAEPAHGIVFGAGHSTWEWAPRARIRGFAHPLLFAAAPFAALSALGCDFPGAIAVAPRVVQAFFACAADVALFFLAMRCSGSSSNGERRRSGFALATLACSLGSWFGLYCGARPLANSAEAQLTVVALLFYALPGVSAPPPLRSPALNRAVAVALSALAVVLRPTAAAVLGPVAVLHLSTLLRGKDGGWRHAASVALFQMLPIGCAIVFVCGFALDSKMYGVPTFVPLRFVAFNIAHHVAELYGTHPWHWYITQGFPAMLGAFAPLFVLGLFLGHVPHVFGALVGWILLLYSVQPHKEFRFVFPALLIAMLHCGSALDALWRSSHKLRRGGRLLRLSLVGLFAVQACLAGYFGLFHQRAPIAVMEHLRTTQMPPATDVDFLGPCHSTPWWSHMHVRGYRAQPLNMSFLDCSPSLGDEGVGTLLPTEVDRFKADPLRFAKARYSARANLPSHIVTFSQFTPQLEPFFQTLGMKECARFSHNPLEGIEMHVFCSLHAD